MPRKPEILAPAGSREALAAALACGADAVYFGLDEGFNARARAANFSLDGLPEVVAQVHRAGARAYLTLNTLVFEPELPVVAGVLERVAAAGVDAIIVQDPAVALLARELGTGLEVHGSTQMTVSSAEGARLAGGLGVTRIVVPRELSVDEIRRLASGTELELEVFIHGALCVSWSGQCLTSEAWGGRSANRGQCAQSCRMPYDLIVDGERRQLGEVAYLLSPRDLSGGDAVGELAAIGVHGLKIEGRQKGPEYVATAVAGFRRLLDGADDVATDWRRMALTYSRGFSSGFLRGSDHQTLVDGRFPKHRGLLLGRVAEVRRGAVVVSGAGGGEARAGGGEAPAPRAGMGVVFDAGRPETQEPGGPVFRVDRLGGGWLLGFGDPGPDLDRVGVGDRVWITSDPEVKRSTERLLRAGEPTGRIPLRLTIAGTAGEPMVVTARASTPAGTFACEMRSETPLAPARGAGLDDALLADKLGSFGGTPFRIESLDTSRLAAGLHLPVSELKALRRRIVDGIPLAGGRPARVVDVEGAIAGLRRFAAGAATRPAMLSPLCRTMEQLDAVIAAGLREVELDWMEMVGLGKAVERARAAGLKVVLATVRVQKPGEEGFDGRLAALRPDGVLVRHWGALVCFAEAAGGAGAAAGAARPALHGDFSLNVTNSITAAHLLSLGLDTVTAAHDLDAAQLFSLLDHTPADRVTVVVHHHIPTFHTEHCVYAHLLSDGRDWRTCGRPCETHAVSLRDHIGLEHPVVVDVGCRNTVFNAQAQSAASLVPRLLARGVRRFRVELVRETRAEAEGVLAAYQDLLAGRATPAEAVRRAGVHEQFGVTRGTMKVLS